MDRRTVLVEPGDMIPVMAGEVIKVEDGFFNDEIKAATLHVTVRSADGRTASFRPIVSHPYVFMFDFGTQGQRRYPWEVSREAQALGTIREGDWFAAMFAPKDAGKIDEALDGRFVTISAWGITQ